MRARMIEHDELVGSLLKKLDDLGVADNTIVVYTTDNGNELMLWPDGGYAPFRGEKGGTWEGGVRVPFLVKWPGKIKPGTVSNAIQNHEDVFATLAAAAGMPDLGKELLTGKKMGDMTYKVHLDGYNQLPLWTGQTEKSARREIFYYDETDLMALRVDGWKMHIGVKKEGSWWNEKYYPSVPYLFHLAHGPHGEDGPGVAMSGGPQARQFFAHKMWALNAIGSVHRDAPEELDGIPAEPGRRHAEPEEGVGGSAGENGKCGRGRRPQQLRERSQRAKRRLRRPRIWMPSR